MPLTITYSWQASVVPGGMEVEISVYSRSQLTNSCSWCNGPNPSLRHGRYFVFFVQAHILTTFIFQLAAKLKLNAPYAHTWLEIIGARWGKTAHLVFMFFGYEYRSWFHDIDSLIQLRLATNIIVSSMLVLGGSATVTDLTGMSTIAVGTLMVSSCACLAHAGSHRLVSSFHLASLSTWQLAACVPHCCVTSMLEVLVLSQLISKILPVQHTYHRSLCHHPGMLQTTIFIILLTPRADLCLLCVCH